MTTKKLVSLDIIKQLISFDTVSRNPNMSMIEYIRDYLADLRIDSHLTFDDSRTKANLYATCGPKDRPGILLSGHTDVVPVDGQDWQTEPFQVHEIDDRFHGRGTCDMKSFIAIALAALPEMLERGLLTPIHLAFSYDEEVGCLGVHRLINQLDSMPVKPRACIVGEPTAMRVVTGHKGKHSERCHVQGLECHSALTPRGVNAIEIAAELVALLRKISLRLHEQGPFDDSFDIPFTTVHTGVINGGTALNIVPKNCWFEYEIRNLPNHDVEPLLAEIRDYAEKILLPEMRAVSQETGFLWETLPSYPAMTIDEDKEIIQLAKALTGADVVGKVSFGTEAGIFQRAGIPTAICGPGSIEQAHKPNEYITRKQIALCESFMRELINNVCTE